MEPNQIRILKLSVKMQQRHMNINIDMAVVTNQTDLCRGSISLGLQYY